MQSPETAFASLQQKRTILIQADGTGAKVASFASLVRVIGRYVKLVLSASFQKESGPIWCAIVVE